MKRTLKLVVLLCLTAVVTLSFAACDKLQALLGGTTTEETTENPPEETTPKPHEHTEEILEAVEPTCTETGLTEGVWCPDCEEILVEQETLEALGHTEAVDEAVNPTCTKDGLTEGKHCSVCNEVLVKQEVLKALGHTEAITEAIEPTCTETGLTEGKICTACNTILVAQEVVDALGHTEVIDEGVDPTCTEKGLTAGKHCSVCDEVLVGQEILDALGHTEVIDAAVEPTCTETGLTEGKHCSVCHDGLVKQEIISAAGHQYESAVVAEPTATANGSTKYTCSVCADSYIEELIPISFTINKDNRGIIGYMGEEGENLVIPAVFQREGEWYRVETIGCQAFRSCYKLAGITIPDSVMRIDEQAFWGCNDLTSVTIPCNVTFIGDLAFYGCMSLTDVTFADNSRLKSIDGSNVFMNCFYLKNVMFGKNSQLTNISDGMFSGCGSLTSINIPYGVTSISTNMFYECNSLKNITIPDSVTSIGSSAFSGCYNLMSITIPKNLTSIGESAFYDCSNLLEVYNLSNSILVEKGSDDNGSVGYYALGVYDSTTVESKIWTDANGYVFYENGDDCYLVGYSGSEYKLNLPVSCNGKDYTINSYAFYRCSTVISVTIPEGVIGLRSLALVGGISEVYNLSNSITHSDILRNSSFLREHGFIVHSSVEDVSRVWVDADGYVFFENESGDCYLMGYTGNESILRLPASCNGKNYAIVGAAFMGWQNLTDIIIPAGVTSIGGSAFYGCNNLTSVTIVENSRLASIGGDAFYACSNLTSVTFGKDSQLISIGSDAFAYCDRLTSVAFGENSKLTNIGEGAFDYCGRLTSINIPDSVTSIGHAFYPAFVGCDQLIQVENGVSYVDKWVVDFDNSIANVSLRENTVGIGPNAFAYCSNLVSITIPHSVMYIGDSAFV